MDTKEKANAYDKALKTAIVAHKDEDKHLRATLEKISPELKENEDERIRKELIDFIYDKTDTYELREKSNSWLTWLEKQGEQTSSQINERTWLYLISDVLTWKDGIGQYLDDPRVQELAKKLRSEYAQKLYNPSILSNSSNTGNNNQEPVERMFYV